jgi:hypothetical protein
MPEPAGLPPPSIDDLATVTTDSFAVPPFSTPKKWPSP